VIKFGCQTYSWQMSGDTYRGRLRHMAEVSAAAGFDGIEPEVVMLGQRRAPAAMAPILSETGLELVSIVLVEDWAGSGETPAEQSNADHYIDYVRHFPSAVLVLCQMPGRDRDRLGERQRNLLDCVNAIGQRAADQDVRCTFHPNSPAGSVFRTAADYEVLLGGLAGTVGYTADVGHIASGGMDPLDTLRTYRDRLDHIHFKDIDSRGRWAPTGIGVIDFPGLTRYLVDTGFEGWIVLEDESPDAERNPDEAAHRNGRYVTQRLRQITLVRHGKPGHTH
jgi:inosose dehydratase